MQRGAQRYLDRKRKRAPAPPVSAPRALRPRPSPAPAATPSAPRGRRRLVRLDVRLAAAVDLVGFTAEDEASIEASRHVIAAHVDDVADEIERFLPVQPESAARFVGGPGRPDRAQVSQPRASFREWLHCVVQGSLDANTAGYLASFGLAHVRPHGPSESRVKARYLAACVARVQALFAGLLARSSSDPGELAACVSAWSKRLMVHLDLLLAVYSSAESSPHWY
jgi:hypothetical protein